MRLELVFFANINVRKSPLKWHRKKMIPDNYAAHHAIRPQDQAPGPFEKYIVRLEN